MMSGVLSHNQICKDSGGLWLLYSWVMSIHVCPNEVNAVVVSSRVELAIAQLLFGLCALLT